MKIMTWNFQDMILGVPLADFKNLTSLGWT